MERPGVCKPPISAIERLLLARQCTQTCEETEVSVTETQWADTVEDHLYIQEAGAQSRGRCRRKRMTFFILKSPVDVS